MSVETNSDRVLRILAVEDDNHIGRVLQLGMRELGVPFEFVVVLSAEEGLQLWDEQPFDLLLVDYNLRGMNGLKLIATLKERHVDVPMVLITAYDSPQLAREARELGVSDYITKPFFIDELINRTRQLLPVKERVLNTDR